MMTMFYLASRLPRWSASKPQAKAASRGVPAFTLLEVLLALALSSLVMMGIVSVNQGVVNYLAATRQMVHTNRSISILLSQFERDVASSFIPFLFQQEPEPKEVAGPDGAVVEPSKDEADKKKLMAEKAEELRRTFFVAASHTQADMVRIDNKRMPQLGHVSFICTNPLQVYGQKRPRLVRVMYDLVADKLKPSDDRPSYHLLRKETFDLSNVKGKVDEFTPPSPEKMVRSYLVLENIKSFCVEYGAQIKDLRVREEDAKKEEKPKENAPKNYTASVWGERFETQCIVPASVTVWLDIWNENKTKSMRYQIAFSIMSYPTIDEENARKKREEAAKKDQKKPDDKNQQQEGQSAQPQAPGVAQNQTFHVSVDDYATALAGLAAGGQHA